MGQMGVLWRFGVVCVVAGCCAIPRPALALGQIRYVEASGSPASFPIAAGSHTSAIYVDLRDYPGVARAANDLRFDIARVTGHTPALVHALQDGPANAILIGTIGKSESINRLIASGKIDARPIAETWESFLVQVVPQPWPGIAQALVIAGSDKRGAIYGIYD